MEVLKMTVTPTLLYGSKSWTLIKATKAKMIMAEVRFLRKVENKICDT